MGGGAPFAEGCSSLGSVGMPGNPGMGNGCGNPGNMGRPGNSGGDVIAPPTRGWGWGIMGGPPPTPPLGVPTVDGGGVGPSMDILLPLRDGELFQIWVPMCTYVKWGWGKF